MKKTLLSLAAIAVLGTQANAAWQAGAGSSTSTFMTNTSQKSYHDKTVASMGSFDKGGEWRTNISYLVGQSKADDSYIMSIQDFSEIVGSDSDYHEIRLGVSSYNGSQAVLSGFLFGYYMPDKNEEKGLGIGGEWNVNPFDSNYLTFKIGGKGSLGVQNVEGTETTISTQINKLTYITSQNMSVYKTPTKMSYTDDNYAFNIDLVLGTTLTLTKNLALNADFNYRYANYQVSYKVNGQDIENSLTQKQDQYITTIGLTYSF